MRLASACPQTVVRHFGRFTNVSFRDGGPLFLEIPVSGQAQNSGRAAADGLVCLLRGCNLAVTSL